MKKLPDFTLPVLKFLQLLENMQNHFEFPRLKTVKIMFCLFWGNFFFQNIWMGDFCTAHISMTFYITYYLKNIFCLICLLQNVKYILI